jgi:hypothetical protein
MPRRPAALLRLWCSLLVVGGGCTQLDVDAPNQEAAASLGEVHRGEYHLGPVEWSGSFPNACSPYVDSVEQREGDFLVGLSGELAGDGSLCDAPVELRTDAGNVIVGRAVTYGVSNGPNDADVSQSIFDAIHEGEFPRAMEWQLVRLAEPGPLLVQFQSGAHIDWTSFWVRNPAVAIASVEASSSRHGFTVLRRETDGTFNDDGGFGAGAFTLRVTGVDGSVREASFDGFTGGALLELPGNLE